MFDTSGGMKITMRMCFEKFYVDKMWVSVVCNKVVLKKNIKGKKKNREDGGWRW